jgi:hypothetical protein
MGWAEINNEREIRDKFQPSDRRRDCARARKTLHRNGLTFPARVQPMRRFPGPIAAFLGFALSGCATIFSAGGTDEVNLTSEPAGAQCRVERMAKPVLQVDSTPATVTIQRSRFPLDIFCTKSGEAAALTVWPGVSPFTYGDLLFGGVPYLGDSLFDADRDLPETIVVRFPMVQ